MTDQTEGGMNERERLFRRADLISRLTRVETEIVWLKESRRDNLSERLGSRLKAVETKVDLIIYAGSTVLGAAATVLYAWLTGQITITVS